MPHVLIKYAHVLICICTGKGSLHFSAISLYYLLTAIHYNKRLDTESEVSTTLETIIEGELFGQGNL